MPINGEGYTLKIKSFLLAGCVASATLLATHDASACTRLVYLGDNDRVITARSMDWKSDVGTNLWIFPRGMQRDGAAGPGSVKWVSRYGSVVASGYDVSTTDGVNEKGLAANLLWLVESVYPTMQDNKPTLSISAWAQ